MNTYYNIEKIMPLIINYVLLIMMFNTYCYNGCCKINCNTIGFFCRSYNNQWIQFFFFVFFNFQFYNFIIAQKLNGYICTITVFTLMGWDICFCRSHFKNFRKEIRCSSLLSWETSLSSVIETLASPVCGTPVHISQGWLHPYIIFTREC